MPDANIEILRKETYLKAIENSVGTKLFRSLFVRYKDTGEIKDILNDGELSCAFFVSNILLLFQILEKPVATVRSLKSIIEQSAQWKKVSLDESEKGDVIFWEKAKHDDGTETTHVGFILDKTNAISTNYKEKIVTQHPATGKAQVDGVYRYLWN